MTYIIAVKRSDQCYLQCWTLILCYHSFNFVHIIVTLSLYGIAFPFSIGDRNFCDLVVRIDTTNSMATIVECTFFQREYTCTIDYGTDQSYANLVYRDTSYIPGRQANITLSQRLIGDSTYYYIVSAERNSLCVRVRGSFRAGRYRTFGVHTLERKWNFGNHMISYYIQYSLCTICVPCSSGCTYICLVICGMQDAVKQILLNKVE